MSIMAMMNRKTIVVALVIFCLLPVLAFQPLLAQSGNQWRIDYFPNTEWQGQPLYTQYANFINLNWGGASPGPGIPGENFSARMTSDAFFYAGTYRFTILADDEFVLYIDNAVRQDTRGQGLSGKTVVIDIPMTQGTHNIRVDYRQFSAAAYLSVNWSYLKPDGGGFVPPPVPTPSGPQSATSVVTEYGDYTPCIQQNIHQANCFQSNGQWNSPNLGSIQMEPQIVFWQECKPDTLTEVVVDPNVNPPRTQTYKCSKTAAGWFPN